jgi:putative nucleotidyltransferase with HDIG domain
MAVPEVPMDPSRARVLIVDDDPSFAGMVTEVLTEKGYDTVRCTDPAEALVRAGDGSFAAAVVDLMMPGMGGIELADRIKESSPDTQIVILTGHGDLESAVEGLKHGVFDYLQKQTIQLARLERSIHDAVERSSLARKNRELVERLRESNRLMTALQDITTSLAADPYLDRLLGKLVGSARELCGAAAGRAILLKRTSVDGLVVETTAGDGAEPIRGARLQPGEGIAALIAEKNEPVLLSRATDHPRYSRRCDEMPTDLPGWLGAPLCHGEVYGALLVAGREKAEFAPEHRDILAELARQAAVAIENALYHERAINFFTHASEILVSILDRTDVFYAGHSRAVAAMADMVTRRMGLADAERRNVHFGALLHDIGKLWIESDILKVGRIMDEEGWQHMRQHPSLGMEILRPITVWEDILPLIHGHHERWDGKGYPLGLAGEEIPLGARVISVAESFDAMLRNTPHGTQKSPEQALQELERCAGTQFDPKIVRLFVIEYRQRGDQIVS